MLRSPRKPTRKISKIPFKVLDAPELQDDFYLNLVDWSSLNVLSVGLGTCVYLWSACTSQVGAAGPVGAHTRVCHGAEGRLLPAAEPSRAQPSPAEPTRDGSVAGCSGAQGSSALSVQTGTQGQSPG